MTANRANDPIDDLPIDENAFLHLKLQRAAGGSVIEYQPICSPYGESLFVISDDHVLVYSTQTGEYVRELEGIPGKKIVSIQCDLNNPKLLYGCTESGDIISCARVSNFTKQRFLPINVNNKVQSVLHF